ncbi:hypothetical protein GGR90_000133 [Sphingopyxis italica]|uniref:Uncharacterized protein n=1 Tax=Sphingopyxis italica TaxID=1129133 RepID=A0A7X5XPJ4_9SPHN|nr:hypothetical protein [Sphingopyxis italica]
MIVNNATDAFLERGAPEVDEKTNRLASQTKIGQQLLAMSRVQLFDRFDLHQQTAVHEQIDTKSRIEARTFEMYIDRHLPIDPISKLDQLSGKDRLIDAFQ